MDQRVVVAGSIALAAGLALWGAMAWAGSKPASGGTWKNDVSRAVLPGRRYRFITREGAVSDDVLGDALPAAGWSGPVWTRNKTPSDWPVAQDDPTGSYLYVDATWNGPAMTLPPDQYISLWELA